MEDHTFKIELLKGVRRIVDAQEKAAAALEKLAEVEAKALELLEKNTEMNRESLSVSKEQLIVNRRSLALAEYRFNLENEVRIQADILAEREREKAEKNSRDARIAERKSKGENGGENP